MSENTATQSATTARIPLNPVPVCESLNVDCTATIHRQDCSRATVQERAADPAWAEVVFQLRLADHHADAARSCANMVLKPDWDPMLKDAALRLAFNHRGIASNAALRMCWAAEAEPRWGREAKRVCKKVNRAEQAMKKAEWEMAALKTQR